MRRFEDEEIPDSEDTEKLENGANVRRASGDTVCPVCGKIYYDHPTVKGYRWLLRTCEGWFAKY